MLLPSIFKPATTGWQNSRYYPVKVVGKAGNWFLMPSQPRWLYWGEGGKKPASTKQLVYFAADCFSRCTCREHGHKDRVHGDNCGEKVKQREHLTRRNMFTFFNFNESCNLLKGDNTMDYVTLQSSFSHFWTVPFSRHCTLPSLTPHYIASMHTNVCVCMWVWYVRNTMLLTIIMIFEVLVYPFLLIL